MKLNKKRISILVSLMCLLVLLVFVFCSFTRPSYSEVLTSISSISVVDFENIYDIYYNQSFMGQFNSLELVCIYKANGRLIALFNIPGKSYSTSYYGNTNGFNSNSSVTFTPNSGAHFIAVFLTPHGFGCFNTADTTSVVFSGLLYYREYSRTLVNNSSYFVFSSSDEANSTITSVLDFTASNLPSSSDELESAYEDGYFEGLESGLIWGEELGYQEGYTEGYQEGIGTGYRDGFLAGEAEGYDTGYADGYQDGYDTGYSDGLEDAPPETVTIVIYEEPVEIDVPGIISSISSIPDSILSGSFDFEFAGINIYGLLKLLIIVFIISAVIFFIIKRSA